MPRKLVAFLATVNMVSCAALLVTAAVILEKPSSAGATFASEALEESINDLKLELVKEPSEASERWKRSPELMQKLREGGRGQGVPHLELWAKNPDVARKVSAVEVSARMLHSDADYRGKMARRGYWLFYIALAVLGMDVLLLLCALGKGPVVKEQATADDAPAPDTC